MNPDATDKTRTTGWAWYQKAALGILIAATLFAVYMCLAFLDPSAEAKAVVGAIGSMAFALVAPFWILYRGRIPFLAALSALALPIWVLSLANMWAARYAGIRPTGPGAFV